jgi:hypothetical protein
MWKTGVVKFYTEFSYKLFKLGSGIFDQTYDASSGYGHDFY